MGESVAAKWKKYRFCFARSSRRGSFLSRSTEKSVRRSPRRGSHSKRQRSNFACDSFEGGIEGSRAWNCYTYWGVSFVISLNILPRSWK